MKSVRRFVQTFPHCVCPIGHTHCPPCWADAHVDPDTLTWQLLHAPPEAPQLVAVCAVKGRQVFVLLQQPLGQEVPLQTQAPLTHVRPAPQACPHAPQLLPSLARLTQTLLHSVVAGAFGHIG